MNQLINRNNSNSYRAIRKSIVSGNQNESRHSGNGIDQCNQRL